MNNANNARSSHIIGAGFVLFSLAGCSGLTFNNSDNVFVPVPTSLQNRSVWHDPSIIQYKLQSLAGYMIEKRKGDTKFRRVRQILPRNFSTEPEPIAEGETYNSLVNASFASSGGVSIPILSIAASLRGNQMMEISIVDSALVHVDDEKIPWSKLEKYVARNPLQEGDERYWVQAVMLTQILYRTSREVDQDATVSGGAYQVDGQVFNYSSQEMKRDPLITMLLLDVDRGISSELKSAMDRGESIERSQVALSIYDKLQ